MINRGVSVGLLFCVEEELFALPDIYSARNNGYSGGKPQAGLFGDGDYGVEKGQPEIVYAEQS